jgi:hypothetical protein
MVGPSSWVVCFLFQFQITLAMFGLNSQKRLKTKLDVESTSSTSSSQEVPLLQFYTTSTNKQKNTIQTLQNQNAT